MHTMTSGALSTLRTGIPYIGVPSAFLAAGFRTSLAPITTTASAFSKSSLIASISNSFSYGTSASASSTFMCPGIRPATGCIANLTLAPFPSRSSASCFTWCCACASAIPYPGTIITSFAEASTLAGLFFSSLVEALAESLVASLFVDLVVVEGFGADFLPPNSILIRLRFIARHII